MPLGGGREQVRKLTFWKWIVIFKFIRRSPNSRACDRKKRRRSSWQCNRSVKFKFWKSQNCHRETSRKTSRNWVRIDRIVFFWIRTNEFNWNYRLWEKVKIFWNFWEIWVLGKLDGLLAQWTHFQLKILSSYLPLQTFCQVFVILIVYFSKTFAFRPFKPFHGPNTSLRTVRFEFDLVKSK